MKEYNQKDHIQQQKDKIRKIKKEVRDRKIIKDSKEETRKQRDSENG